jgi:hypothetical protein
MLLGVHPLIQELGITLYKPGALLGAARTAIIQIERSRTSLPRQRSETAFGSNETLLETHEAVLELLRINPGQTLPVSVDPLRRLEWLVSGKLSYDGQLVSAHCPYTWTAGRPKIVALDQPVTMFSCSHRPRSPELSVV